MPVYDYRCTRCGDVIEVMHAIGGEGPAACVVCGGPMRKTLSPPAIHFKGSGWAKKDARTAAKSATATGAKDTKDAAKSKDDVGSGSGAGADKSTDASKKEAGSSSEPASGAASD